MALRNRQIDHSSRSPIRRRRGSVPIASRVGDRSPWQNGEPFPNPTCGAFLSLLMHARQPVIAASCYFGKASIRPSWQPGAAASTRRRGWCAGALARAKSQRCCDPRTPGGGTGSSPSNARRSASDTACRPAQVATAAWVNPQR